MLNKSIKTFNSQTFWSYEYFAILVNWTSNNYKVQINEVVVTIKKTNKKTDNSSYKRIIVIAYLTSNNSQYIIINVQYLNDNKITSRISL